MPSLKTFRLRIRSVQSTQKITKAMKMVAAAKLRRAQEQAAAARPYARIHGQDPGVARRELPGLCRRSASAGGHRFRPGAPRHRRHRRPWPLRRLQQHDRARGAPPDPRAAERRQDGQDLLRRPQGPRPAPPRLRLDDRRDDHRSRPSAPVVRGRREGRVAGHGDVRGGRIRRRQGDLQSASSRR